MTLPAYQSVTSWVFDLDNTLYPPKTRLFDQIEERMRHFMAHYLGVSLNEADRLRGSYWAQYGTTLAGLMAEHNMHPDAFLEDVHDIDFTVLDADLRLRELISALPGRKVIYTNGTAPYAQRVSAARGLEGLFDAVYGIEDAGFHPKPRAEAFREVFGKDGLDTKTSVMFEDEPRNLEVPHGFGLRCVYVGQEPISHGHVHHQTEDLAAFLEQIVASGFPHPGPRVTS